MRNSLIQILLRVAVVDGGPMLQDEAESAADAVLGGLRCDRCRSWMRGENYNPLQRTGFCSNYKMPGSHHTTPEDFCSHWEQR